MNPQAERAGPVRTSPEAERPDVDGVAVGTSFR